ncbi:enoyl-CoA hydratase-related protein [Hahella sp. SMD15-11]|uniref:Enoyl-CoA hydratase-related protein n=1 Tax=Thermohahella caldifontis TaxID=3142973 RepID=A0AB39UXW7_9GAMM
MIATDTENHIVRIGIDRADKRNAFDEHVIRNLTEAFRNLPADTRAVLLYGKGKHFSAGADLAWMKRLGAATEAENIRDAERLADLMDAVDTCPVPVVCRVTGAAYGGAVGLIACADIVLADTSARLCLSEVRLGLIPAVISPYVIRAMGARQARRFMLSAEEIPATVARQLGLIHDVTEPDRLDEACNRMLRTLTENAPSAVRHCKQLIRDVSGTTPDHRIQALTARAIAERRASTEAQEGLNAFLEKRAPAWRARP